MNARRRRLRNVVLMAVVAAAAVSAPARAQECLPPCRAGFMCQSGQCVAPPPRECLPPCRQGFSCADGACVPVPGAALVAGAPAEAPKPAEPPRPRRFELGLVASLPLMARRPPDPYTGSSGTNIYGPEIGIMLDFLWRESAGGLAWLDAAVGWRNVRFTEESYSSAMSTIAIELTQLLRLPLGSPAWDLLLDRRVSLDLGLGAHVWWSKGDTTDLGGQALARLSIYWFWIGPTFTYGLETGPALLIAGGPHLAF